MTNTPSPSSSSSSSVVPSKRKWTSKTMKTWVATDPSSTEPNVHHGDKRSAARAEKIRKMKEERAAAQRAPPKYRMIHPPPPRPAQTPTTPAFSLNNLIPFDDEYKKEHDEYYATAYSEGGSPPTNDVGKPSLCSSTRTGSQIPYEAADASAETGYAYPTNRIEGHADGASTMNGYSEDVDMQPATTDGRSQAENKGDTGGDMDIDDVEEINTNSLHAPSHTKDSVGTDIGGVTGIHSNDRSDGRALRMRSQPRTTKDATTLTTQTENMQESYPASAPCGEATYADAGVQTTPPPPPPALRDASTTTADVREDSHQSVSRRNASTTTLDFVQDPQANKNAHGSSVMDLMASERQCGVANVCTSTNMERTKDKFNEGWRRFGPQGRDISGYVPRYPHTPTVTWPTQLVTTTPYIPDLRRGKSGRNKLKWDRTYVNNIAKKFKSSRDRPDLCVHAKFTTLDAAFELIDKCNVNGVPLVFDDFPDSARWAFAASKVDEDPFMKPVTWSTNRIRGVVGANLDTPRDFQDAALREAKPMRPYVTATLREFHTWLKMPGKVRCILDLTCGFRQADQVTDKLADNVVESFSSTFGNMYAGHFDIAADVMKTLDWFLLHTAGFLTFGHIDASGMATSAEIRGAGLKEWIVFSATNMPQPKRGDTRQERRRIRSRLIQRIRDLITAASSDDLKPQKKREGDADWDVDGCVIELRPGMKYYQPAGTVHAAYTPVPTAAAGKHFFTYNDLHRMEVSRRVQLSKESVTNHDHNCGVQLMLITMAAALPVRATTGQGDVIRVLLKGPFANHNHSVFFRKPMIALALMLVRPQDYMRKPERLEDDEAAPSPTSQKKRSASVSNKEDGKVKAAEALRAERIAEYNMTQRLRSDKWAEDGTAFDRLAYTVARKILIACKTKYPGDAKAQLPGREYIFEGSRWDDPGPPLDVRELTDDLRTTHVDDVVNDAGGDEDSEGDDSESEVGSESDLTDLE
ncbi:uncharacterized protein SCHCODRAFT_02519867 [Schizophyllum commune H4-8]|uniref:JmjC domain-containing protein n=1 Tax=Schizophyllum commune (strain H4-8 / FGSC 9210) TaxID=578458 RepID=D8QK69_SCHCM|nr:uncharacterized protein SCHCODRAFT_02519867 [Schizophyllum commune H4-8]KAI5885739.1 hypothetical protein SCHCODRAFT_02519867 [Schizophyllum commune H4-8]